MTSGSKAGGLAGVVVGETQVSTVGQAGHGLTYRGYSIEDLSSHSTFEEVAYLLIHDQLPNASQLADYKAELVSMRALPAALKTMLEQIPADAHRWMSSEPGALLSAPWSQRVASAAKRGSPTA